MKSTGKPEISGECFGGFWVLSQERSKKGACITDSKLHSIVQLQHRETQKKLLACMDGKPREVLKGTIAKVEGLTHLKTCGDM